MRTLTVRHSASTPSSSAARAPFCPNLAGIQDHNDLLEVMRLHLKTPGTRHGEGSCGRFSGLHLEFLAVAAGMGVDLIILVASDLQDHLLADRDVDLFAARVDFAVDDRDVDRERGWAGKGWARSRSAAGSDRRRGSRSTRR